MFLNKYLVIYIVLNSYKNVFFPKVDTDVLKMVHPTVPISTLFLLVQLERPQFFAFNK